MAKAISYAKAKTEKLHERFQAIEGLLFVLGGLLESLKTAEESVECAWKHLQKKYGVQTTEEHVNEIKRVFFNDGSVETIPAEEKNIFHFSAAALSVLKTQEKLSTLLNKRRKDSIALAVKKLRQEYNQILGELHKRKFAQVKNKKELTLEV